MLNNILNNKNRGNKLMGTIEKAQEYTELINGAKEEFLGTEGVEKSDSIKDIVNQVSSLKKKYDELEKRLESYKKFFRTIGTPGETFDGDQGYVSLIGRASSTVEPKDLKNLLESIGRPAEFTDMVTVKIADARVKLGTMLFDKIATTVPNASITVKIGSK